MNTDDLVKRAKTSLECVTDGPWAIEYKHGTTMLMMGDSCQMCDETYYPWVPDNERDWHFIAAARQLLPDLADRIEQLEAALTRANAATAAAYELAAQKCDYIIKNIEILKPNGETYETPRVQKVARGLVDLARQDIRALATPDQTAALDNLIAEAEARAVENISELVRGWRNTIPMTGEECANAILAASKKGGV